MTITSSALIASYHAALRRNSRGTQSQTDTVIIALWDATFLANQKAEGLQKELDKITAANAQSAAAVMALSLKLAGVPEVAVL